jgi:hypothetical protein
VRITGPTGVSVTGVAVGPGGGNYGVPAGQGFLVSFLRPTISDITLNIQIGPDVRDVFGNQMTAYTGQFRLGFQPLF